VLPSLKLQFSEKERNRRMPATALAPILPVLDQADLTSSPRKLPEPWDTSIFISSARAGIAIALQDTGIDNGEAIWVPSYYCLSMTIPIEKVTCQVRFYPLTESLEIDMSALRRQFSLDIRAIVAPHFFGFPQKSMPELRAFCSEKGIFLLEDCAHSLLGKYDGKRFGDWGDYSMASLPKFFPVQEGGLLASIHGRIDATTYAPGMASNLKAWVNLAEEGMQWGRNPPKQGWARLNARRKGEALETTPPLVTLDSGGDDPESMYALTDESMTRGVTKATKYVVEHSDLNAIAAKRRDNFLYFLDSARGWKQARPIFTELPDGTVPYMFPLELKMPTTQFAALKAKGVPMYRWEHRHPDFHPALCAVGARYATSLIQLPVNQSLTDEEAETISHTLFDILR
jgi:perosamine synthetase